jgi:hypothetical protein
MRHARRLAWLLSVTSALGLPLLGCGASTTADPDAGSPAADLGPSALRYPIVDTGQTSCFDLASATAFPAAGAPLYGQDAQFDGNQPSYTRSADGLTVLDDVTGLTWQQTPDTNGDGTIDASDKLTWAEVQARPAALNAANYGGYNDWRLPTIKELYSLMNFMGTDVGAGADVATLTPFLDRAYFDFGYGDTAAGERVIDAQFASSTLYVSTTMLGDATLFGVNFADGRIKGYGLTSPGMGDKTFYLLCVRGSAYGVNDFVDNGDSTITDRATGLMWTKGDSGIGLDWQQALAWAETKNGEGYLGHDDWRLPNAKELQSIVDYTRSPATTSSAAIDPLFDCTGLTDEAGTADYPFYWTSTTHRSSTGVEAAAVYFAFGRAMGYMTAPWDPALSGWLDVHGAGAQRSDPKTGDPADFPTGRGPQGDAIRIYNYVRLVRNGATLATESDGGVPLPPPGDSGMPPPGDGGSMGPRSCTAPADCTDACPPGSMGCTCAPDPMGASICVPTCNSTSDCPTGPTGAMTCDTTLHLCHP